MAQQTAAPVDELAKLRAETEQLRRERDEWKRKAQLASSYPATVLPSDASLPPVSYPPFDPASLSESFARLNDFLIEELVQQIKVSYSMLHDEAEYIRRMLHYNTKGGKMNRGLMVLETARQLYTAQGKEFTSEDYSRFGVLGWCIEYLQAWLLMVDDMMDHSLTRRGQPCWYKVEDVGNVAYNDAAMVRSMVFILLKRHFQSEACYTQLLDLFIETEYQTECGQLLDTVCERLKVDSFTASRWELIVTYKTAFYSFYLPVACGMLLCGIQDPAVFAKAREILIIMGVYFQAQDDYLDCFGTEEQIGKVGTDIQDRKCGWLFVHAYSHPCLTPEDKAFLDQHYGKCAAKSPTEAAIKAIYSKLGLPELFQKYEEESYQRIMALKSNLTGIPWGIIETFLKKIYKRSK